MNAVNQASESGAVDCATPLIIPVAVHFQNTGIPEACAIDMALDQIQILNNDFAATNADISEWYTQQPAIWPNINNAESCIQFCLATSDHPAGSASLSDYAVTIDQTTGDFNAAWSGYMNIWVRDIGPLGYSPLGGTAMAMESRAIPRPSQASLVAAIHCMARTTSDVPSRTRSALSTEPPLGQWRMLQQR